MVGGTVLTAGIAGSLFMIVKSLVQLPLSRYVDRHNHKVQLLIVGTFVVSTIPFLYIMASHIYVIYLAQVLYGLGSALVYPTWPGMWSTHLDKHHESFEWSLYATSVGIGAAVAGTLGAVFAQLFGFVVTFLLVGAFALCGCFILFALEKHEPVQKVPVKHYHRRRKASHRIKDH